MAERAHTTKVGKVDKSRPATTWTAWAATRADAATLAERIVGVVAEGREEDEYLSLSIDADGYERPFKTVDEFRESVSEADWVALQRLRISVFNFRNDDVPSVTLSIHVRALFGAAVTLQVTGGSRRERNAIEPEIVELVEAHKRDQFSPDRAGWLLYSALWILLVAIALVAAHLLSPDDELTLSPGLIVGGLAVILVGGTALAAATDRWAAKRLPPIELLPDDQRSTWDRERPKLWTALKLAGALIVGFATVAGTIVATIATL